MPVSSSSAWFCAGRTVDCATGPLVMGIVNVTPDSFSDGGLHARADEAIAHGIRLVEEGAAILDIGGESSRPGAEPVSLEEELRRVLPVVRGLASATNALLSVDTVKAEVARQALAAGAHIVNDITALRGDSAMAGVVREAGAGVVLMHMQGTPRTMQEAPVYTDVVAEVRAFLTERMAAAVAAGIPAACVALDPGIGFGKTVDHNVALLRGLPSLAALGRPLLVGVSRKRFLGHLTGRAVGDRLLPSLVALAFAVAGGARILRVHDVKDSCDAARLAAILSASTPPHE